MDNANGTANGSDGSASASRIDAPSATCGSIAGAATLSPGMEQRHARTAPLRPGAAHRPAMIAPYHVHGSVLEGGDNPAVLAQPASAAHEGEGSRFHPDRASHVARRARRALGEARWAVSARYRRVSDSTGDFVHDNPWKSIALAGIAVKVVSTARGQSRPRPCSAGSIGSVFNCRSIHLRRSRRGERRYSLALLLAMRGTWKPCRQGTCRKRCVLRSNGIHKWCSSIPGWGSPADMHDHAFARTLRQRAGDPARRRV